MLKTSFHDYNARMHMVHTIENGILICPIYWGRQNIHIRSDTFSSRMNKFSVFTIVATNHGRTMFYTTS